MKNRVTLCWMGTAPAPPWPAGEVVQFETEARLAVVQAGIVRASRTTAGAALCWDAALGAPDAARIEALLDGPGDVWHAGLRLGTGGLPGIIDFIHPTWMHNRDPDPGIEATSWRLSLSACLIRTEVLRQLGGPHPAFQSLAAAGLELGHRYLRRGAFVRRVPDLVPKAGS